MPHRLEARPSRPGPTDGPHHARRLPRLASALVVLGFAGVLLATACSPADEVVDSTIVASPQPAPSASDEPPDLDAAGEPRFTLWAQGGLPEEVPGLVAAVRGVVHSASVRSGTVGLVASRTADGRLVDDLVDGWRVPVQAAAVDPMTWLDLVDDPDVRGRIGSLRAGTVLVGESFATGRELGVGARLDLVGTQDLDVVAVVPDGTFGDAELVLHEHDARGAGITRGPTIVLEHAEPDAAGRARLAADLAAALPPGVPARVLDSQDASVRRDAPLVLSLTEVKARFGEFAYRPLEGTRAVEADPLWEMANIVRVEVPILGRVRCHRLVVDDLAAALQEVVDAGLADEIDPDAYDGCWYARRISTERPELSSHSWGIALDVNVDLDLPGLGPPPHPDVVAAFMRHGFRWGGDFLTPDNHHFEWVGGQVQPPPPSTG